MELNIEFTFFQNLLRDILTRRVIFKKFEDEMKKTDIPEDNDIMALVWYGYIVSQLSDCRKFFDCDRNTHSFKFVVKDLRDEALKKKHSELFDTWTNDKLGTVLNKYLLHADMSVSEIKTEVSISALNSFVDELEKYIKAMISDLSKNYLGIGGFDHDGYLLDRENEVVIFFEKIRKVI